MRNLLQSLAATGAAGALLAAPAAAQHPDFSGTWTFDAVSSQGANLPTSATKTITQHGDTLIIDQTSVSAMGPQTTHMVETTDGKPTKNSINIAGQPVELTVVANWAHDTLMVKSTGNAMGNDLEVDDQIVLSADRKTMVGVRDVTFGGQSQGVVTMVYAKKS